MELHIVILSLLLCTLSDSVLSENWPHYTVLDSDGIYHLYWDPPADNIGDSVMIFKLEVKAKGYIGFGFSPNGGMPGSDIVTCWVRNGEIYFQDRYADAFSLPSIDDQQDYELIDAYENDTFTVFEFSRKLDTCDENDMVINEGTMRLIYAYSQEDPAGDDPFYHRKNRGAKSLMLLQNKANRDTEQNLTSLLTWDVRSPDIEVSPVETLYWCKIVKTPQVSEKHHVIHVKPTIQEGHELLVHHIILYECVGGTPEVYEKFIDHKGHECNHPNMPEEMKMCEGVTLAWAIGGQDMVFPEHVGLPIDKGPPKYYSLEIHYDNPQRRSGMIDNSGFALYYTPELREFDAGVFQMGATIVPRMFIPPRQKEYIVVGHSNNDCVGSAFPDDGVNVFAVALHSHLLGRAIKARHFRGNTELPPLGDDRYYDFNYQEYRFLSEEVDILPNDQITVECTYDSSKRSQVTFGGAGTQQEMCMVFILYYPLVNQYSSLSMPTFDTINEVLETNITKDAEVYDALGNYDWANADIDEVENAMRYSKHNTRCYYGDGQKDIESMVSYPSDLIPYEAESTCNR